MNTRYQKIGLAILVAAVLMLTLTGAASQADKASVISGHIPIIYQADNPCTPETETINLAGEADLNGQVVQDYLGTPYLIGHYGLHVSGEDAAGVKYTINAVSNINGNFLNGAPLTETYSYKLISQGSTDNFYVKALVHVSPNGEIKSEFESVCKG